MEGIITFSGKNEQLFTRLPIEILNPKLTIIVPETHNAILTKDGQMLQTLSSGKYKLSQFVDVKTEADSKLEVLFMSKTAKLKLLWGTATKFMLYDPKLEDNYKIGMSGDFDVQIGDPRKCYLYLVGADSDLTSATLQERLVSHVVSVLENVVAEYVNANNVVFNQITLYKEKLSEKILIKLNQKLMNEYGIAVFSFNIANIIIDENDLVRLSTANKSSKTEDGQVCSDCGCLLKNGAKFCYNCGKKLSGGKLCPDCSTENVDNARFCVNCGHKF